VSDEGDVDLDELRDQYSDTDHGTQLDEDPAREDYVDELVVAMREADADSSNMVGFRHTPVAALLDVIEDSDRVDEIGKALDEAIGQDPRDDYNRSKLAALALLVGIDTVEPELVEDLADARSRRERRL
jgi:hypothetical protein